MKSKYLIARIGSIPMSTEPLADLPGSSMDPGTGPVVIALLDGLLDDAATLTAHRAHRSSWYADLIGPLLVPAAEVDRLVAGLDRSDHARPIILTAGNAPGVPAGAARQQVRAARDLLAEDDRVDLVGVRLAVPIGPRAEATGQLLHALDFSVPTWIEVPPLSGWQDVLRVVAADGAENLTLLPDGAPAEDAAALLRTAVDLDLTFRLGGAASPAVTGSQGGYGWLNVLCAVRAALNGAETPALAAVLGETGPAPLTSALRRMSEADAAVTRAFLVAVEVADPAAAVGELMRLGLLTHD
jgi:hypothetical protein